MTRTTTDDEFATYSYDEGRRPLKNATTFKLLAFVGATLVFRYLCPYLILRAQDPSTFSCGATTTASRKGTERNDGGGAAAAPYVWCETNAFDVAVTNTVVVAPMVAGRLSHKFTFVACPAVGIGSMIYLRGPGTVLPDLAIFYGTQYVSGGLKGIAKILFHRQRPCYHYGRQNETEAVLISPRKEFTSFYSGDTALAFSYISAALAIIVARGWDPGATTKLSRIGFGLASIGSVLRIVGFMHWCTDVLAGILMGLLVGFGLPTLLFSTEPARDAFAKVFALRSAPSSAAVPTEEEKDSGGQPGHGADRNEGAIEDEEEEVAELLQKEMNPILP